MPGGLSLDALRKQWLELRRDTLTCLVSLCVSLLTGERGRREMVAAICAGGFWST